MEICFHEFHVLGKYFFIDTNLFSTRHFSCASLKHLLAILSQVFLSENIGNVDILENLKEKEKFRKLLEEN